MAIVMYQIDDADTSSRPSDCVTPTRKRLCSNNNSDGVDSPTPASDLNNLQLLSYSQPEPASGGYGGCASQPAAAFHSGGADDVADGDDAAATQRQLRQLGAAAGFSFSQPAHIDDMLLNSQFNTQTTAAASPSGSSPLQRLVKRMTRLVAKVSCEEVIRHLTQHLNKLGYTWKIHTPGVVSCTFLTQSPRLYYKSRAV